MSATFLTSLDTLVATIPDGALVAVPKDTSGVAMAATRALLRRGIRNLHLVCVPTSGLQADLLIGAGAVTTVETSAITMGESGAAPCFTAALRKRSLRIMDTTCPAIYATLQAAEKGIPFIPLRGMIGTDVLRHQADWKVIDNPFAAGDPPRCGSVPRTLRRSRGQRLHRQGTRGDADGARREDHTGHSGRNRRG